MLVQQSAISKTDQSRIASQQACATAQTVKCTMHRDRPTSHVHSVLLAGDCGATTNPAVAPAGQLVHNQEQQELRARPQQLCSRLMADLPAITNPFGSKLQQEPFNGNRAYCKHPQTRTCGKARAPTTSCCCMMHIMYTTVHTMIMWHTSHACVIDHMINYCQTTAKMLPALPA